MKVLKRVIQIDNLRAGFLLAGVIATLLVYLLLPVDFGRVFVRFGGYWFTLFLVTAFIVSTSRLVLRAPCSTKMHLSRAERYALSSVLLLGAILLISHGDFGAKIMMDDEILASTAKNLHLNREVYVPTFGRWINNVYYTFNGYVDKRPWLYPFSVSLLHDLSGYRYNNPFYVNAFFGVAMLAVLYLIGRRLSGLKGAILLPLLWLTLPLYYQNATGGGMDMLNVLLLAGLFLLSMLHLESPDSTTESSLVLGGVLLAYCRYESALFLIPVGLVILLGWWRRARLAPSTAVILATPALIGLLLQNKFFSQTESLWELNADSSEAFAFSNFGDNVWHAFSFFTSTADAHANSIWLFLLGLPSLLFFILYCLRNKERLFSGSSEIGVVCLFGVFIVLHLVVILFYHEGRLDLTYASRFALPFYLLACLVIIVSLRDFSKKPLVWVIVGISTGAFIIGSTLPKNAKAVFSKRNYVINQIQWVEQVLDSASDERILIINEYTLSWTLRERACITPETAFSNLERLSAEFARRKFTAIYLVDSLECIPSADQGAALESSLPLDQLKLNTIAERSFRPFSLTRVSRVVAFDL